MKVFFTRRFKEDISKPYKTLHLGRYRLRRGDNLWGWKGDEAGLTPDDLVISSELIGHSNFHTSYASPGGDGSGDKNRYYLAEGLEYNGGLQMFLDIPEIDQTMYSYNASGELQYQVIIFFCRDITNAPDGPIYPGFIVFEDFGKTTGSSIIAFHGLNLTSRKNILTIPPLPDLRCKLVFEETRITEELEKPWGNLIDDKDTLVGPVENGNLTGEREKYISLLSWKSHRLDVVSGEEDHDWVETVYVNKFGIKIY